MRRFTLFVVALVGMAVPAMAQEAGEAARQPVIVTTGHATVKRAPDQAWVSIAAETRAAGSADAQRLNAEAMQAVMAALARAGMPAESIRTTGYSLQPDMEYVNEIGRAHV